MLDPEQIQAPLEVHRLARTPGAEVVLFDPSSAADLDPVILILHPPSSVSIVRIAFKPVILRLSKDIPLTRLVILLPSWSCTLEQVSPC
jgi:hypothetical protein